MHDDVLRLLELVDELNTPQTCDRERDREREREKERERSLKEQPEGVVAEGLVLCIPPCPFPLTAQELREKVVKALEAVFR